MKLRQQINNSISFYPDVVALNAGSEQLTYEQLGHIGHYFGSLLKSHAETTIGIFASRTIAPYYAVLACFFAGKTYVPLSLKLPAARLAEIIKLAQIKIIFADESCIQQLNEVLGLLPGYSLKVYK
jgi:acyl-coenzyme A synthetase/AMP-(fatty) acid ligase